MSAGALIDVQLLETIIVDGIERYVRDRRARVPAFSEATFGWTGAADIHRAAMGPDILRAPANAALALPAFAVKGAAIAARRFGRTALAGRLDRQDLFFKTDVASEVEWRLYRDLLELPLEQPRQGRRLTRDALAETILADPRLGLALRPLLETIEDRISSDTLRSRINQSLATYSSTRIAATELATLAISLSAGALIAHQLTPGALSLGPAAAAAAAEKIAVLHFPLGATLGEIWYAIAPAPPAALASGAAAAGLLAVISVLAAFSGIVTDPLQELSGLHKRRLDRLIDALENDLTGNTATRYHVRDHYLARFLDFADAALAIWRFVR